MPIGDNNAFNDKLIKNTAKASNTGKARKKSITSNTSNVSKIGMPSTNPETDTYDTTKATFFIKKDLFNRLKNYAYWDRHSLTEAFNLILEDGLKGKNTKEREK